MRFDRKNPKFLIDLLTLIFAIAVIVLTIIVILGASDTLLAFVFYAGAAMFAANVARGFVSGRYFTAAFLIPALICVAGGLMAQGMIRPWIF